MNKKFKLTLIILLCIAAVLVSVLYLAYTDIAVMNPQGWVGERQRDLIITATWLMLIVVIPVYILTFIIAWKFRADNAKAKYSPDWDYSLLAESIWWGVPFLIIIALSVITWKSSYELDPFKPLDAKAKPITIQVVALPWKWLFIYPEQKIATVNFVQFPEQTPISFAITADAPMNSFWIPKLGGQIFAMSGMVTKLHLIANEAGSFRGCSANLSGRGFSGMYFTAKATSETEFLEWVQTAQHSPNALNFDEYKLLLKPSENNPPATYVLQDLGLYDWIVMKYMMPMPTPEIKH